MSTTLDYLLLDAVTALRRHLAHSRRTDLSKAFAAWVLGTSRKDPEFRSIVNQAAAREGAQQDFQTVAVLGFAAQSETLTEGQLERFRKGLHRQAGREAIVDGVPMAFCLNAIGLLGVAAGTKALGDLNLTSEVARWICKFLENIYEMHRAEDWQRCLFAAADRQLGRPLDLAVPKSVATADVRMALVARGLIEAGAEGQAREDAIRTLDLTVQEAIEDLDCDRAALRLAALEWVTRAAITGAYEEADFISEPEIGAYGEAPKAVRAAAAIQHENGLGIGITNRPPLNISDRLHGFNQLAGTTGVPASHRAGADQSQPAESAQMPRVQEAQQAKDTRKLKKPVRRSQKYEGIDKALRAFAASRPKSHQEVFLLLEDRKVAIPNRRPFKAAGGWLKGFQQNRHSASAWLSQTWARLSLPAFPRGPQK